MLTVFSLSVFIVSWFIAIYLVSAVFLQQLPKLHVTKTVLYVIGLSALGLVGEVTINSVYNYFAGSPLWQYRIVPIHHAYTSLYAVFLWGIAGLAMYLTLYILDKKRVTSLHLKALILCFESWVFETMVNVSFYAVFGRYIFYYLPSDMGHFTSMQVVPFYLIVSYILILIFRRYENDPAFFILYSMGLGWVIAFLAR
ncbi:MAG: hypothetical protein WAW63_01570 [Candidatus Saccharimonadales bacterium]|jgi:hypothetical protein|nr:hypothetical protein [Candidatus Saccharibacteria bacterium]